MRYLILNEIFYIDADNGCFGDVVVAGLESVQCFHSDDGGGDIDDGDDDNSDGGHCKCIVVDSIVMFHAS